MKVKFFKISCSTDLTIVGEYPQMQKIIYANSPYWHPHYFRNVLTSYDEKLDFIPIFDTFSIVNKAKFTDILSTVLSAHIFNEKMLNVLYSFTMSSTFSAHPIKVQKGQKTLDYYFFYLHNDNYTYLDTKETVFYEEKNQALIDDPKRYVKINNISEINDWEKWHSKFPKLKVEKLIYKPEIKDLDLLDGTYGDEAGYFVSPRLKEALERAGISGISFEEVEKEISDF